MQQSDVPKFRSAITALCLTFNQEATEVVFDAYWIGLSDLSIEAANKAVFRAIRECESFPKPVELRRLAGELQRDARAIAAWEDVLRAVPLGSWKHIDFADLLINATIRNLGGWPNFLGRLDGAESEKWARADFLKTYQSFVSGSVSAEACAPLAGLSEATSLGGVRQPPVPVRIECEPSRKSLPCHVRQAAIASDRPTDFLKLTNKL